MRLIDTLSGIQREIGIKDGVIKIFVCGPTVYDEPHLGHLKTYITFDVLAKFLRYSGKEVFYLQNITDIDDKILKRAEEMNVNPLELSQTFRKKYIQAMKTLKINAVNLYAPATAHIKEIVRQIKSLERKGYTYRLPDGIYYRVWMDKKYGVLSGQVSENLIKGKRAEVSDYKEDERDFVLWKFKKEHESIWWESPWGKGRPGWHIEDTAIATKYLGKHYDIHGAGRDLLFPHHESELSILRALKGNSRVSDVWMYTGLLTIQGEKMSKSTGNFMSVSDALGKYTPEVIRMCFLSTLYGSTLDFSDDAMEESRKNCEYISRALRFTSENSSSPKGFGMERLREYKQAIIAGMNDELNTRKAIGVLMELASELHKHHDLFNDEERAFARTLFEDANSYLEIIPEGNAFLNEKAVDDLVTLRNDLRKKKLYKESDEMRKILKDFGIVVEDSEGERRWHYE